MSMPLLPLAAKLRATVPRVGQSQLAEPVISGIGSAAAAGNGLAARVAGGFEAVFVGGCSARPGGVSRRRWPMRIV